MSKMSRLMLFIFVNFILVNLVIPILCEVSHQEGGNELQTRTGFPSAKEFQKITSPLLMTSSLSGRLVPQDSAVRALPQPFVTFVSPVNHDKCTLRQFLGLYREEDNIYLDGVIIDSFKALLPLPSALKCPRFTDNLVSTRMIWRWSESVKVEVPIKGINPHSLHCLLDGRGEILVDQTKIPTKVKPGDCIYLPPKVDISWHLQDRVILVVLAWNPESDHKCTDQKKINDEAQTLAYFNFKDDPSSDLFRLLSLNTLSSFIEDYHMSSNCTEDSFMKRFQKKQIKKGLLTWDEECQEIAKELFRNMDTDKNSILSTQDVDTLSIEAVQLIAGLLEDRLADMADIAEDQEEEKPQKRKVAASLANELKVNYEKELQAILEDGFNEILQEANIQGKVSFDKDGNPQVTKTNTAESSSDDTPVTSPKKEPHSKNAGNDSPTVDKKDEL